MPNQPKPSPPPSPKESALKGFLDALKNFGAPKPEKLEPPRAITGVRG